MIESPDVSSPGLMGMSSLRTWFLLGAVSCVRGQQQEDAMHTGSEEEISPFVRELEICFEADSRGSSGVTAA